MATHTVFYSWQSDSPNPTNRGFIEECLEKALKELKRDPELKLDPCIDRDVEDSTGSPDIAATIFEKIKRADVFLGDVTFIDPKPDDPKTKRMPNPNVLVELGYAVGLHGWDKVLWVFNKASGRVEDLPFDLRSRKAIAYTLSPGEEKAEVKKALISQLRAAIQGVISAPEAAATAALTEAVSSLGNPLATVLIFGEELDQRELDPGLSELGYTFGNAADHLREIASVDAAETDGLADDCLTLAGELDAVSGFTHYMGNWDEFQEVVNKAVTTARSLKARWIEPHRLDPASIDELRKQLRNIKRKVGILSSRCSQMDDGDLQQECSTLGEQLLRIAFYKVDSIQAGLAEKLQSIGRSLHLIGTMSLEGLSNAETIRACNQILQAHSDMTDLGTI